MRLQCTVLVLYCCLYTAGFAAILRPYRVIHKPRKPKPPRQWGFIPSARRCCHTGLRVAEKSKICNIVLLAFMRKTSYEKHKNLKSTMKQRSDNYFPRARLSRLSEKVSKCSAVFPRTFESCCSDKKNYFRLKKKIQKCRLMRGKKRRICRKAIQQKDRAFWFRDRRH